MYDFSENSEPACELAVESAKAFGAELLIIHVIDAGSFPNYADWMIPGVGEQFNQLALRAQEAAEDRLGARVREYGQSLKGVRTFCKVGSAPKEIVSFAAEESVDLIVVGTHGRTGCQAFGYGKYCQERAKDGPSPGAHRRRPVKDRRILCLTGRGCGRCRQRSGAGGFLSVLESSRFILLPCG